MNKWKWNGKFRIIIDSFPYEFNIVSIVWVCTVHIHRVLIGFIYIQCRFILAIPLEWLIISRLIARNFHAEQKPFRGKKTIARSYINLEMFMLQRIDFFICKLLKCIMWCTHMLNVCICTDDIFIHVCWCE